MPNRTRYLPLSWRGFAFPPFHVPADGVPLSSVDLPRDLELMTVTRAGSTRAFVAREMAYHHVAQGELSGEPYVVSF